MEDLDHYAAQKKKPPKHPYVEAGFFSRLTYLWIIPLFYKGYKKGLQEEDLLTHLKDHDSEILGEKLETEWRKELKKEIPSLWRAYRRMFGLDMLLYGFLVLILEIVRLTHPLTMAKLLEYFKPQSKMPLEEAYIYAGIIGLTALIEIHINHKARFLTLHLGMCIRVASVALVYRKAIRLSKSALAETTVGQMVNLISNDVSRFENCTLHVNNIWVGPIQLVILIFMMLSYAGWTALVGIGLLLCIIPFQIWMGKKTSLYRLKTAIKTDERIRLMNEIIGGVQVIKMYTWEKPFTKLVKIVRRQEMTQIQKNFILKAIHIAFNIFLTKTLIYACVLVYVLMGNSVNAQYVFGLSLFYELMRQCLSQSFALGIFQMAEAIISTRRIREFLLYEELDFGAKTNETANFKSSGILIEDVSTKWTKTSVDTSLSDINFRATHGELVTIIGKVGSGKSTLLHVILKELTPTKGHVKINGSISYASQDPWLFVGSVRQNILFGQEYDPTKYQKVIEACALGRDFKLLPHGDRTIIRERGISLSGGQRARINLARAVYKDADIYLLDDPLSAVDAHVGKQIFKDCIEGYLQDKCVVLVTHQLQYLKDCRKIYLLHDGEVQHSGTYEDIKNAGNEFTALLEELKRTDEDAKDEDRKRKITMSSTTDSEEADAVDPTVTKEQAIAGKVTWKIYKTYFRAGGNACKILFLILIFVFSQVLASSVDYFLSVWVDMNQMKSELNSTNIDDHHRYSTMQTLWLDHMTDSLCLKVYSTMITLVVPLIILRGIIFFKSCINASTNLHNNMFSNIVYAPMRFFHLNPSGRILNRFSKDMNLVDEYLPVVLADTVQVGLMMTANITMVAVVLPMILVPTLVILVIFYGIRVIFLATSINVKRYEALTRSPVYVHLTTSLQGLTTIRAFGAQNLVTKEFDHYQNSYNSAFFTFLTTNRAFAYWLDVHVAIFLSFVTFGFLLLQRDSFGGSVGLAITQAFNLTGWFQFAIRQWSEMDNTMTSVERVDEYGNVTAELDLSAKKTRKSWPENGAIVFNNVSLRYSLEEEFVLKNLSFAIKPMEKVGIVGRTGAGKSSIITALFRLAETKGTVLIDGVDSKVVPLNTLRSSISIIPQEPVLFSGTLRKNLDPFDEFDDQALWDALNEIELKQVVSDLPNGLGSRMSEGGSNFSAGQRQLLCLGRAIIRNNKILVLDEATANVDPHTDTLIQSTIRKKFAHCTVLTIAHRLHTIMDSDKVLVMDAGRVMEFGHPYELLLEEKGVFYALVQETGQSMASNLKAIAEKAYIKY